MDIEELERKSKEVLWQHIASINEQIKEEKAIKAKPTRLFNEIFKKNLSKMKYMDMGWICHTT